MSNSPRTSEYANRFAGIATAILTAPCAALVLGVIFSLLDRLILNRGEKGGAVAVGFVETLFDAGAFCQGTALAAPFLLLCRVTKSRQASFLTISATMVSYVLLFVGVTRRVALLFDLHTGAHDFYEPLAARVAVQCALVVVFALASRSLMIISEKLRFSACP